MHLVYHFFLWFESLKRNPIYNTNTFGVLLSVQRTEICVICVAMPHIWQMGECHRHFRNRLLGIFGIKRQKKSEINLTNFFISGKISWLVTEPSLNLSPWIAKWRKFIAKIVARNFDNNMVRVDETTPPDGKQANKLAHRSHL